MEETEDSKSFRGHHFPLRFSRTELFLEIFKSQHRLHASSMESIVTENFGSKSQLTRDLTSASSSPKISDLGDGGEA